MLSNHDITEIDIPFYPREVDALALVDGKLASQHDLEVLSLVASDIKVAKVSKKNYALGNSWITTPSSFFAISSKSGTAGKGYEGKVKWVQNVDTKAWFAMKVRGRNLHIDEMFYLKKTGRLIEEQDQPVSVEYFSTTSRKSKLCYLMKGNPGVNLELYLPRIKNNPILLTKIMINLLKSCQDLQNQRIFHGDLKLDNVMIDPITGEVSLIDFGFSERLEENNQFTSLPDRLKGTPIYTAPEMIIHFKADALTDDSYQYLMQRLDIHNLEKKDFPILSPEKISIYSLGVMFAELLGVLPDADISLIPSQSILAPNYISQALLDELLALIVDMKKVTPSERPDYNAAIDLLSSYLDMLKKGDACKTLIIRMLDYSQSPRHLGGTIYLTVPHSELNDDTMAELIKKKNALERCNECVSSKAFVYKTREGLVSFLKEQHLKDFNVTIFDCHSGKRVDQTTLELPIAVPKPSMGLKIAYVVR